MQLFEIFEYLFNRDQPDMRFVCTLPATSCRTHLSVEPSAAPRSCAPLTPLSALTTHARMGGGSSRACVRAPSARSWPWRLIAL